MPDLRCPKQGADIGPVIAIGHGVSAPQQSIAIIRAPHCRLGAPQFRPRTTATLAQRRRGNAFQSLRADRGHRFAGDGLCRIRCESSACVGGVRRRLRLVGGREGPAYDSGECERGQLPDIQIAPTGNGLCIRSAPKASTPYSRLPPNLTADPALGSRKSGLEDPFPFVPLSATIALKKDRWEGRWNSACSMSFRNRP